MPPDRAGHVWFEVPEQCAWKDLREVKASVLTPETCSRRNSPEQEHVSGWRNSRCINRLTSVWMLNCSFLTEQNPDSCLYWLYVLVPCMWAHWNTFLLFTLFKVVFMAGKALNAQLLPVGVVLYCQTGSSFSRYLRLIGLIQWECSVCYGRKRLSSVFLSSACFPLFAELPGLQSWTLSERFIASNCRSFDHLMFTLF